MGSKLTVRVLAVTELENKEPIRIVEDTARNAEQASLFNHASMAVNNHFFFKTLSPTKTEPSAKLKNALCDSFGSMETLRDEMYYTAMGMFGPGFVWLVRTGRSPWSFAVLATYLAGSPYAGAHWRQQSVDNNAAGAAVDASLPDFAYTRPASALDYLSRAGEASSGKSPRRNQLAPGGIDAEPILCVNTWEHVWVPDYNIYPSEVNGKSMYLRKWWDHIDWDKVAEHTEIHETRNFK
jgi:Fe-Mn family superoxide dismutase